MTEGSYGFPIWVFSHALVTGRIERKWATLAAHDGSAWCYSPDYKCDDAAPGTWARSPEEAVVRAEQMREDEIARLQELNWTVDK